MSLSISDKKAVVAEVSSEAAKAKTMVLAEYRGITVDEMAQLRAKAREQKVYLRVVKNTLARLAVEGTSFSVLTNEMKGPLLYSLSEDPVAAAKVLHDFAKSNKQLVLRAGCYEGKNLGVQSVTELASIPGREQLLTQLVSMMRMPLSSFVRGLAALATKREEA